MDWKKNTSVGVVAAILVVVAVAFVIWYATRPGAPLEVRTFICESSGKTFDVTLDPKDLSNEEYASAGRGNPVTCKFDGKKDAYLAEKDASGKWVRAAGYER